MKSPGQFARAYIERPYVSGSGICPFRKPNGHDDEVFVNGAGGIGTNKFIQSRFGQTVVQIHSAIFSKRGNGFSRFGIQGKQPLTGAEKDAFVVAVFPVGNAPIGIEPLRVFGILVFPDFFARSSIQGKNLYGSCCAIHNAIYNDGIALNLSRRISRMILPRHLQILDVFSRNLSKTRIMSSFGTAQKFTPNGIFIFVVGD